MSGQTVIVLAIVAAAVVYLGTRVLAAVRLARARRGACGCGDCH